MKFVLILVHHVAAKLSRVIIYLLIHADVPVGSYNGRNVTGCQRFN